MTIFAAAWSCCTLLLQRSVYNLAGTVSAEPGPAGSLFSKKTGGGGGGDTVYPVR